MNRCEEYAHRGTGYGTCNTPLDERGQCPNARSHVEDMDPIRVLSDPEE